MTAPSFKLSIVTRMPRYRLDVGRTLAGEWHFDLERGFVSIPNRLNYILYQFCTDDLLWIVLCFLCFNRINRLLRSLAIVDSWFESTPGSHCLECHPSHVLLPDDICWSQGSAMTTTLMAPSRRTLAAAGCPTPSS